MSDCRYLHVTATGKLRKFDRLDEALGALKEGGYLWLDYFDPAREDLNQLVQPLGIHPLSVEDCLDADQVPKIEDFHFHAFILFNTYDMVQGELAIDEVDFFLGENFLVSVHGHHGKDPRFFDRLEAAVTANLENVRKGPDFLLHVIMDYIVDKKFASVEALQEQIDGAEEAILKDATAFQPGRLMHVRRQLLALRKSLFHEREILVKICRKDLPFIPERSIFQFRDIYDHLTKFFEATEIYREMTTNLMEMYLSMVNNQMSKVANRTNRALRRLTVINTVFMPLMLLAGIGGMSEWTMMTGADHWPWSYPLFFLLLGVVAVGSYLLLRLMENRPPAKKG